MRKMQFYKSIFYQKNEALLFITTLPCLKVFASLITKTNPKVRGTLKSLPKIVSKRSHQEECVQSAKTARCVAPCVPSQALQVTDELPSFPSKAEFSQIEGQTSKPRCRLDRSWNRVRGKPVTSRSTIQTPRQDCLQKADTGEHRADVHSNIEKYVFFRFFLI